MTDPNNELKEEEYNNNYNLPWVEKYRPAKLDDIKGQDKIVQSLKNIIENGSFPHLLFYGGSGFGKTSVILSVIDQYFGKMKKLMVMRLDASDDRGINSVRDEIKAFAEKKNYFQSGIKVIILDEADSMTFDAQFALRRIIEKYSNNTRFCLICNYENKIIPAIKSRCAEFKFSSISDKDLKERLKYVANCENIKIKNEIIETISKISKGDLRKAINLLQTVSLCDENKVSTKICYSVSGFPNPKEILIILKILLDKKLNFNKSLAKISKLVYDNGYSISLLLKEINETIIIKIKDKELVGKNYISIFSEIAKLENQVIKSTFGDIYLSSLISIFKKNIKN
jgi:replication factor C subunit 3/5